MSVSADEPGRSIGGATDVVGVIGWPVERSLSPAIHNAAFAAAGLDWVYVPMPVVPGALPGAVAGLVRLGFRGANVTMPHKTEAAAIADELSDDARRLRAVNTLVVTGRRLVGDNTDVSGFERFLRLDAGFEPEGRRALVVGAGGAGRAVALALARSGVATIQVAVREESRASDLVDGLIGTGAEVDVVRLETIPGRAADLVVNATPLGADGRSSPPLPSLASGALVVDLVYGAGPTPLQTIAREAGVRALGGLGLLLHQAALSFELWTGVPAPFDAMSAAASAALADRS